MKLGTALIILLSLFFFVIPNRIFSQDQSNFNYEKAQKDYEYSYNLYRQADADYQLSRNQYLTYQTLSSKEKAIDSTKKALQARDEVTKTYLVAIKLKLNETSGVTENQKSSLGSNLDEEVKWFLDHKNSINSITSLDDLVKSNTTAREHYLKAQSTIVKALMTILTGKEDDLKNSLNNLKGKTLDKVDEIKKNGDKNTAVIQRWLTEVEIRVDKSNSRQEEAIKRIDKLEENQEGKFDVYNGSRFILSDSLQFLREANSYLKEIFREIKTKD